MGCPGRCYRQILQHALHRPNLRRKWQVSCGWLAGRCLAPGCMINGAPANQFAALHAEASLELPIENCAYQWALRSDLLQL